MKPKFIAFSLFVALAFSAMTGCEKIESIINPNWLIGTWVLDREKTMEAFSRNNQKETPTGGFVGEIAAAAIRKTIEAAISPMENATFSFSETEYVETFNGRIGEPKTYEIVSRPAKNQIKTVDSANIVNIYHKEGDHIWYYLRGKKQAQVYLKRVSP